MSNNENWYEQQVGGEGEDGHLDTASPPSRPNQRCSTTPPSNIVTSWNTEHEPPAQPHRVSKRKGTTRGAAASPPTTKRLSSRTTRKHQENDEKPHSFKAKPVPIKVLEGVVGMPEKKVLHPTVPKSPAFALNKRVRLDGKAVQVKQPLPVKAHPLPHFGIPFGSRLPESHQVKVCPFSFEQREQDRKVLKEKRQEDKHKEQMPQFKAQPLPNFDNVVLPARMKLQPTKPEPFKLLTDERGAMKHSHWEQMVKKEQKHKQEAALFKARPNTVIHKQPFRLKKEDRAAVAVKPFELATEKRAIEWQEYEKTLREKELLCACREEERRREEEQRENQETARLRQEQVHKAQPIRQYKPVVVKKSDVALTVPEGPEFSDRFHL